MILKSLTLEHFRQFYGRQTIAFADHRDRNVTIIYGPNGGGKTALLNAFTWAFYEETSPAFEQPEDLINHRAWAEAQIGDEVTARVIVVFERDRQTYTVERFTTDRKGPDGRALRIQDGHVDVSFIDEGGRSYDRTDTAAGTINQILPERLHRFFFFDGERIEQLVKPDSYSEIEDAIKTILGLKAPERAIGHLDEARKVLEKEYSDVAGDEVKALKDQLDDVRDRLGREQKKKSTTEQNRSGRETQLKAANARLAQLDDAADLQRRREELEELQNSTIAEIDARNDSLAREVSDRGHLAFIAGLATEAATTYNALRTKGEIPAPLKRQFVDDLLNKGRCICGSDLHKGEEAYASVADWRQKAGREDVETAWTQLSARAEHFKEERTRLFEYVHETRRELAGFVDQRAKTEDRLSQIKDSMSHLEHEEIQQLEARRDTLKGEIDDDSLTIRVAERDIQELETRRHDLERGVEKAGEAVERARVAQRRVVVAREARDFFAQVLELRTKDVRAKIDARVREVYSRITFKTYVPVLDDGFRLRLRHRVGGEEINVAKSTGESQILSLAFVGATAEYAQERQQESQDTDGLGTEGGIYPMVMDSPFGSLDENYQREIAEAIPQLAPQVILLVSKSQGLHAVQEVLLPSVGREYVVEFHTPKEGQARETITLRSGVVPYIEPVDGDFEWAEVKETA